MAASPRSFDVFDDERVAVRVAARAACAVAATAFALWVTDRVAEGTGVTSFFATFPIVLAAALLAGTAAGLGTVALLTAAFAWQVFYPYRPFQLTERQQAIRLLGFAVSAGLVACVAGALRAAYRRAGRLRLEAEEAAAALRRLQEARDDLLRALTHDVRTPLSTIVNHAEVLRRSPEGGAAEVSRRADAIRTSAQRIGTMVSDLVETFQLESGQIALRRRTVELAAFCAELAARLEGTLQVERVRWAVSPQAPAVDADPDRLERILVNLLSNALKYSPPGTPVTVATEPADGQVAITVTDRGPGIARAETAQIFERFYRGSGARAAEGLGLGLYVTRLLVEAHGGRVSLDSSPAGTTFRVVLPAAPPAPATAGVGSARR